MYKAIFEIYHKGCWGSSIGLKFPEYEFYSIDVRWIKGSVAHIIKSVGDPKQFDTIINYLKNHNDVKSIDILSRSESEIYMRSVTLNSSDHPNFSHNFFENNCFTVEPIRFQGKYEIWTLGSANKDNLSNALNEVKKRYEVNIKFLSKDSIIAKLTEKQRNVFISAKYFGYYKWPRQKSVTEIASLLKIPKTVFLSHLRKAENKILNNYSI